MVQTPRDLPLQPDILLSRICMILQMVNISCSSCLTIYLLHIIKSLIDGRLVVSGNETLNWIDAFLLQVTAECTQYLTFLSKIS